MYAQVFLVPVSDRCNYLRRGFMQAGLASEEGGFKKKNVILKPHSRTTILEPSQEPFYNKEMLTLIILLFHTNSHELNSYSSILKGHSRLGICPEMYNVQ